MAELAFEGVTKVFSDGTHAVRDLDLEVEVRTGDPAEGIVAASHDVGLLVIGSRGRGARRAVGRIAG